MQSGPSGHRAAGLWLATALPLTAERAVSAMGFWRGNEELERGEEFGQKMGSGATTDLVRWYASA